MNRWGLLRDHDFRQLFVADTISQVGSQVSLLALPLVAVVTLHATPFEVGALAALGSLIGVRPALWVGAVGGCLAFLPVFLSPLRSMRQLPTQDTPDDHVEAGKMGS